MPNYSIKYVTDENGNRCLPKSHTDAITDDNGTTLTNLLAQKASLALTTVSGTSVTQALTPNTFYSFGEVTSLTVTLGTPVSGITSMYAFEFDSGSTATTLSVPSTVKWEKTLSIAADTHYEINIKYDASTATYYGLMSSWEV